MASKGKQVDTGKGSSGKRKRDDHDKTGRRKRKNPGVLQFFEDSAYEVDESSDDSDFEDDFLEDEFGTEVKVKNEPGKAPHLPIFPKEEEMSEEELEKMLGERYKPGSSFVTYAEDGYENKRSIERNTIIPSAKDPTIWKVKCMVGRERHSAFCLMQKYVDLHSLGTKLQIISAFALEHVKGFIYIEADKQCDVNEACNGLCGIYLSRVAPVPDNEISHLLSVRSKCSSISVGMWARVKNGKYKGDLAQVVAVNDARKKATVKLIPRIDLQAMGEKCGGGVTAKKTATPAPRLISSSELEEFRPLIQYRRDRDTDKMFEVLDGMMLKDGYLYKKVPIDSLSFWGVTPSEDELLKFEPSKNDESKDLEWLSQLYGEKKKKVTVKSDKAGGKGEGSSSSSMENSFEVHDLVFFGRTGFGVVVGTEKDESFRILKEGSKGPVVVTAKLRELKKASFDKKFTALDQHKKIISITDTVRVLEGPLEDRQGIVKQIYRGTLFLYDETEQENSGYFCSKAQMCEKIKISGDACKGKGDEPGPGFEDFLSSPKSPLSPKKPWQGKDDNRNFNREDKDGMYSVGQSLRIRVGPLKGYLCRVLAIRHSDVTVKLDSQQKILTVKCEHLSEVRGKSSTISLGEDPESVKPFDLLGTQDGSGDWMDGAGTSTEGERWKAGGLSTERSSWPAFSASSFSLQPESSSANPLNPLDNDLKKDAGDSAWETKVTPSQSSSWGAAVADEKAVANIEQVDGWGKSEGSWNKGTSNTGFGSGASDAWGKEKMSSGDQPGSSKDAGDNWGRAKLTIRSPADSSNDAVASWGKNINASNKQDDGWKKSEESWDRGKNVVGNQTNTWNNANAGKNPMDSWGKGKDGGSGESTWGKAAEPLDDGTGKGLKEDSWGKAAATPQKQTGGWGGKDGQGGSKADWNNASATPASETGSWGNASGSRTQPNAEASGWKKAAGVTGDQTEKWKNSKKDGEDATGWGKNGFGNQGQSDSWNKSNAFGAGSGSSLNKQGGGSWNEQGGGSSWNKQDGGSSWNKGRTADKDDTDRQGSWEGGRGSGGRRGRGGGRGGRDNFGRGRSFDQGQSSGWSKEGQGNYGTTDRTTLGNPSSWNSSQAAGGWGKAEAFDGAKNAEGDATGWGKGGLGNQSQSDSWNKPKAFGADGGSSWNRPEGGSLWNKPDGGSSGNKQGSGSSWDNQAGGSSWGKQAGGSSWGKQADVATEHESKGRTDQNDSWERPKHFGGGRGFGGWNKGRTGDDDTDQQGSWEGGRGSGGRRGRGGGRGGRDNFGRGRSFDQGQSSGWSKESQGNYGTRDGTTMGNPTSWNSGHAAGGWGKDKAFDGGKNEDAGPVGWKKATGVTGDQAANWGDVKKDADDATGRGKSGFGNQSQDSWNKPEAFGTDGGSSWNKQEGGSSWEKQGGVSSWNNQGGGSSWSKQAGGSSWSKQANIATEDKSKGRTDQNDSWDKRKSFGGWNKGGMGEKEDTDQQGSWERPKAFEGGRGFGGRRGRGGGRGGRENFGRGRSSDQGQGQSSSWSKESQENLSSWNSGQAAGGWGQAKAFDGAKKDNSEASGWKKAGGMTGDQSEKLKPAGNLSSWNSGQVAGGWGPPKAFDGAKKDDAEASGWKKAGSMTGDPSEKLKPTGNLSSWNSGQAAGGWGPPKAFNGGKKDDAEASGWKKTAGVMGDHTVNVTSTANVSSWNSGQATGGWGPPKAFDEVKKDDAGASGWKKTSDVTGDQAKNWGNVKKDGGDATGWGKGGN